MRSFFMEPLDDNTWHPLIYFHLLKMGMGLGTGIQTWNRESCPKQHTKCHSGSSARDVVLQYFCCVKNRRELGCYLNLKDRIVSWMYVSNFSLIWMWNRQAKSKASLGLANNWVVKNQEVFKLGSLLLRKMIYLPACLPVFTSCGNKMGQSFFMLPLGIFKEN